MEDRGRACQRRRRTAVLETLDSVVELESTPCPGAATEQTRSDQSAQTTRPPRQPSNRRGSHTSGCQEGVVLSGGRRGSGTTGRRSSYFTWRSSVATQKPSDSHTFALRYFTFYNELRNVCSLKPSVECHCFANAEVSAAMDLTAADEEGVPRDQPGYLHHPQAASVEEMQFQQYLREIQRLNPHLREGCLFVDGLYELVSSRLPGTFLGNAKFQSNARDMLTVHTSGTLLLQKYWHRPDDPSEFSAYLTVASSFVEYIHSTYGPQGVGQFLRRLDCSIKEPQECQLLFKNRDILSLEFKWKKFVEAQVNVKYRLSILGMVCVLLRKHLAKYWILLAIILGIIFADVALHLAFALASGYLVAFGHKVEEHQLYNVSSVVQHSATIVPLLQRVAMLLGAILLRFIVVMFSNMLQAYIAVSVSRKLRQKLSARLHHVTPMFLDDHSASSIISTFIQDVATIENVISTGLRAVVWGALMLVACVAYTLLTTWPLGLALTAVVLLGQLIIHAVSSTLSDHGFAKSQATSKLGNLLKEQVDGFHINRLYGLSEFWMQQMNGILYRQYSKKATKSFILTKFMLMFQLLVPNLIGSMLTFAIILLTQFDMLSFERGLSIFVFFTTTVISLTAASSLFPQLQTAAVSMGRINALLYCEAHTSTHDTYQQNVTSKTSGFEGGGHESNTLPVEFKNVCFSYSSVASHWNLFDINLNVKGGERVVIVGSSGSGKSTLLHLLMKMYEPTHGSVVIGDESREEDNHSLQVAATFQFNHIFSMSIRDNIRIGRLTASDNEVEKAAEMADLHAWICSLPRGYDTAVSSGGSSLSGGQKQRIAIARMLLSGAPVFVLDEVTSALDPSTEKRVFSKLLEVSEGKTVVAVTHRLDQAEKFDRIVVLSHGRIKEEGTHSELMEKQGAYWQMKTNQDRSHDEAVPIVRRRGSLSSELHVPVLLLTPSDGVPLLINPALNRLDTVTEEGETYIEKLPDNFTANSVNISSIKVVNGNLSRCSKEDHSCLTIDSHPYPVEASTPDPHNVGVPSSTAQRIVMNLGSFSEYAGVQQQQQHGSFHFNVEQSLTQVRQEVTVLYLDDGEKSDRQENVSLHKV